MFAIISFAGSEARVAKAFAGPAILFSRALRDTIVERNLIVDCQRGIALGLMPEQNISPGRPDHEGGVIRRNVLCNLNSWADEAIEVNASPGTQVEHNTVLVEGKVPWSISVRFPAANAQVRNNLCNRQIILRDGAKAEMKANIVAARRDWFVNAERSDLRLVEKTYQRSMVRRLISDLLIRKRPNLDPPSPGRPPISALLSFKERGDAFGRIVGNRCIRRVCGHQPYAQTASRYRHGDESWPAIPDSIAFDRLGSRDTAQGLGEKRLCLGRWRCLANRSSCDLSATQPLHSGAFVSAGRCRYLLNDVIDAEADRKHPRKRHRPIAAGQVSPRLAIGFALALAGSGFAISATLPRPFQVFGMLYLRE